MALRQLKKRVIRQRIVKEAMMRRETMDAILWDILNDRQCRVKIVGSDRLLIANYPENIESKPAWLKPGNSVKIMFTGGNRNKLDIVGHGTAIPNPTSTSTLPMLPPIYAGEDAIITDLQMFAFEVPTMGVWIQTGTYRIDGETYQRITTGDVSISAAHATLFRIDKIVLGADGVFDVITGTAASSPVEPNTPADHVVVGTVLVPPGTIAITNAYINRSFSDPEACSLTITVLDELPYSESSCNITVAVKDQYERTFAPSGGCNITLSFMIGNGTISNGGNTSTTSLTVYSTNGSVVFTYTRLGTDSEISPVFNATASGLAFTAVKGVRLLNLEESNGGAPGSVSNITCIELSPKYTTSNKVMIAYTKPPNDVWYGASIYRAYSLSGEYSLLAAVQAGGGVTGHCSWDVNYPDTPNIYHYPNDELVVDLDSDETLTSCTFDELIADPYKNLFALLRLPGVSYGARTIFCKFQTAELIKTRRWKLSGVIFDVGQMPSYGYGVLRIFEDVASGSRGYPNLQNYVLFAMYQNSRVVTLVSADAGKTLYFKAPSTNTSDYQEPLSEIYPVTEYIDGVYQIPLPPCNLTINGAGARWQGQMDSGIPSFITNSWGVMGQIGCDIVITWQGRNRFCTGQSTLNNTDTIHNDTDFDHYHIKISAGTKDLATLIREVDVTDPTYTYTLAQRITDSTNAATVHLIFEITQVNDNGTSEAAKLQYWVWDTSPTGETWWSNWNDIHSMMDMHDELDELPFG